MNGGHSGLFPITEDSARLATPQTPSGVSTGQKPPPAGNQVPPVRDPFLNSSGVSAGSPLALRAHEHPPRTSTTAVEQVIPTMPFGSGNAKTPFSLGILPNFRKNPEIKHHLLGTGNKFLAEARSFDQVWGIGLRADGPDAHDPHLWRGSNLLG